MKKLLIIFALFFVLPAWSACSIAEGESVCTISNTNSLNTPLFQNNAKTGINSNQNMNMPSKTIQQSGSNYSFGQTQNQKGIQMQGSLGCQFGNCDKNNKNNFVNNNR